MERAICSMVHLGSLKSTPRKPFTCRSMNPGAIYSPPESRAGSTAEIVPSKVTRTGVPPKVSIPIQFMRALLYTQDSHSAKLASARFCNLIKLLKRAAKLKFSLAIAGAHRLKRDSPSAAAHPGKQISGEVALRGVRAATSFVNAHWLSRVYRRQPSMAIGRCAVYESKELLLQPLGNRTAMALAHWDAGDRANGRDFRGGSGKEHLVGDVQHLARHDGFDHRNIQILGQANHGVARDAGQHRCAQRRGVQAPVADQEDIFAGPLADVAGFIERDAFRIAIGDGLHFDELRIHVIGARFGQGGQGIGGDALPTRNADIHAAGEGFFAQILAPDPAGQIDVHGVVQRIYADVAIGADGDGPDVAGVHVVDANQFLHGLGELIARVAEIHAVDFGGIRQAPHVVAKAEDGGAGGCVVATYAFENAGSVTHHVGEDMYGGLFPGNETSVVPDSLGGRQHGFNYSLAPVMK